MAGFAVGPLPGDPLMAAAEFYARVVPQLDLHRAGAGEALTLIFTLADHTHKAWRLAAVQALARRYAPQRINAVASDDTAATTAALAYLAGAQGVTGQSLRLDGAGAGKVVGARHMSMTGG